jgi:hypothetical protein
MTVGDEINWCGVRHSGGLSYAIEFELFLGAADPLQKPPRSVPGGLVPFTGVT